FSLVIFRQEPGAGKVPEINTVRSEVAYLRFDQPIKSLFTDMDNRKIVGGELRGTIVITNNRRTPQTHDDIEIRVDGEPVFYDEKLSKIWTDGFVTLLDKETRPHPTTIRGKGMDLHLSKKDPQAKAGADKKAAGTRPKNEVVSDVDKVVLRSAVEMHL